MMDLRPFIRVHKLIITLMLAVSPIISCNHPSRIVKQKNHFPPHYREKGIASWYGKDFHGKKTASGEVYDMYKNTAAHKYLPLGSYVKVTNLRNQNSVMVKINDRGPFIKGRNLDLSYGAARTLHMINEGLAPVQLEVMHLPKQRESDILFIQVGSFVDYENAMRVYTQLTSRYPAHLFRYQKTDSQAFYRVCIGPYTITDSLKKKLRELDKMGFTDSFIIAK